MLFALCDLWRHAACDKVWNVETRVDPFRSDLIFLSQIFPRFPFFCRDWSIRTNTPLHQEVILRFIYVLSVIMSPITPHWCEHIYAMFGHTTSVSTASWPQPTAPVDKTLRKEYVFFRGTRVLIVSFFSATSLCSPLGLSKHNAVLFASTFYISVHYFPSLTPSI